jgi:methylmalonyl-CoA/ethylmalonyl-CoA epimerase
VSERELFGAQARFHHVGLAVPSIREACPDCEPVPEPTQGVSLALVELSGITIELLEPLDDSSPIARSLRKGIRLLHLCYEVPSLEEALECCRAAGFHRLTEPSSTTALGDRRVVWVFSKHFGLFELLERDQRP